MHTHMVLPVTLIIPFLFEFDFSSSFETKTKQIDSCVLLVVCRFVFIFFFSFGTTEKKTDQSNINKSNNYTASRRTNYHQAGLKYET